MKKECWLVLLAGCMLAATFAIVYPRSEKTRFSPEQVDIWYKMSIEDSYDMFEGNFGNVISEREYTQLQELYEKNPDFKSEVCVVHTMNDGTMVFLRLQTTNYEDYTIGSIDIAAKGQ